MPVKRKNSSPTSSPHYPEILKLWGENKEKIAKGEMSRYRFFNEYIKPLDPDVNEGTFYAWVTKTLRQENETRFMDVVQKTMKIEDLNEEDKFKLAQKMQAQIRFAAKQLFHTKVYEFIQNPQMLKKMTLRDAQRLYTEIRREEDREKELAIKAQGEARKSALGLFALQALTDKLSPEEILKLRAVVSKRINDNFTKLQPISGEAVALPGDGEPDNPDNAEGTSAELPRPTGGTGTG
jgi:hypothetical protein